MFFSQYTVTCIVLSFLPNSRLNTTIVTKCKNKNGNLTDTSNYRHVAVDTVALLGHFILYIIPPFLRTTDNRLGFSAGHAADQCTFLLKQTASYFVTHGSSGHAVFICLKSIP